MEIKSSRPATIAQAKEILEQRKSESAELGYEQNQALEHAERFAIITAKKAKEMEEKLCENEKINKEIAAKFIDIRPESASTVRAIAAMNKIDLSEEDIKEILKVVS